MKVLLYVPCTLHFKSYKARAIYVQKRERATVTIITHNCTLYICELCHTHSNAVHDTCYTHNGAYKVVYRSHRLAVLVYVLLMELVSDTITPHFCTGLILPLFFQKLGRTLHSEVIAADRVLILPSARSELLIMILWSGSMVIIIVISVLSCTQFLPCSGLHFQVRSRQKIFLALKERCLLTLSAPMMHWWKRFFHNVNDA